ncbi:MAG TPA: nucleotide exchange factor GrpE [Clostridiales bacterium]|nr:nucleotide exchange factor GrpE [Clostridiales bacterium]
MLNAKENKKNVESTDSVNSENVENTLENCREELMEEKCIEKANDSELETIRNEYEEKLTKATEECQSYVDRLQRLAAEFDNYKKRTAKEKERLYQEGICDTVSKILPVVDNFGRALNAIDTQDDKSFREGVSLVAKQLDTVLSDIGVEKIEALGCEFDPNIHNAVMHIEDEKIAENTIVEELQSGYQYKDQVIRYSMVKVAN